MNILPKYILSILMIVGTASVYAMDRQGQPTANLQEIATQPVKKPNELNLQSILSNDLPKDKIVEFLIPLIVVEQHDAIVQAVKSDDYKGLKKAGRSLDFYNSLFGLKIPSSFNFIKDYRASVYNGDFSNFANRGQTLLHMTNDCQIIKTLLEIGINVNAENQRKQTPLHVASSCHNLEGVKLLLNHGADPDSVDIIRNTPLSEVVFCIVKKADESKCINQIKLVELLLDRGANINGHSGEVLFYAVCNNNLKVATLLLDRGANINYNINTSSRFLSKAIVYGSAEMTKLLLERGVHRSWKPAFNAMEDEDEYNCLLAYSVLFQENIELIKLLLDDGIEIDVQSEEFENFVDGFDDFGIDITEEYLAMLTEKINRENVLSFEEFTENPEIKDLIVQARIDRLQRAISEEEIKIFGNQSN